MGQEQIQTCNAELVIKVSEDCSLTFSCGHNKGHPFSQHLEKGTVINKKDNSKYAYQIRWNPAP